MPDLDELRRALHDATEDLHSNVTMDRIRRRVRSRRVLRNTAVAAGVALVVSAVAVPALDRTPRGGDPAANPPATASACPGPPWLGVPLDTGVNIQEPGGRTYAVVIGLLGTPDHAGFTTAFRDGSTGQVVAWDLIGLPRDASGGFTVEGQTWWFQSSQLVLGANRVLDVGVYGGAAARITVASEGRASEATLASAEGWTLFWVQRTAKPLPTDANTGPRGYQGPERLSITAYDTAGQPLHTVTGGHNTGNLVAGAVPDVSPTPC
ncbi:hypothetical protein Ais01nite_01200 [Asanoa ishikariensis]|uniref:Uncharacterized protein n=1 Tax=Asanoa ishikariensis TaxID=137265 RepID=A0A1H3TNZ8_9ACTN|nr:hypothetical protein [Asanoa ishikariensis]GIF62085.1 hypothetical protein Ais01nite_01200 [Asanoa ishikariensis]SDZ51747.1 hypothetical protein SAMN05421684_6102 [Asanoa ishikariensis]